MQRSPRRGPPKRLEKMLFINHKEELMLDDRLSELKLRSRQKIMELDLERIKVRNEWRNSRKKNVTMSEAIASGMLPAEPTPVPCRQGSDIQSQRFGQQRQTTLKDRRPTASAPPRKKTGVVQPNLSKATTFFREPRGGRESIINSFPKQPTISENDESLNTVIEKTRKTKVSDTVGTYVLDEFEKVSQVVPDILRALAKKKEQYEEEAKNAQIAHDLQLAVKVDLMDYEPDMNKVRKTVGSVKKLRHRMAISKKLEVNKPKKSFDQMVRDRTESIGEYDEYTDGICVLMKRKLDKKRRDSAQCDMDKEPFGRRASLNPSNGGLPRRVSSLPGIDPMSSRRPSTLSTPGNILKSSTTLGFGSQFKLGSLGQDDTSAAVIDEDELINRQRIFRELSKYQLLQGKVHKFLLQRRPGSVKMQPRVEVLN